MFCKEAKKRFLTGKFGGVFPEGLLDNLEEKRIENDAEDIGFTSTFDHDAKSGETIIEVTLTIKELP